MAEPTGTLFAGDLWARVVIQQRNDSSRDSYGQPVESWTTLRETWANPAPSPKKYKEIRQLLQTVGTGEVVFVMRYRDDVTPQMRIVWGGRTFNVEAVVNIAGFSVGMAVVAKERI